MTSESPNLVPENRVLHTGRTSTVDALRQAFAERIAAAGNAPPRPLAIALDDPAALVGAAAWSRNAGADVLLLARESLTGLLRERLFDAGYAILTDDGTDAPETDPPAVVPGRVTLLTSGTTGEPKLVTHGWPSLFTLGRAGAPTPHTWLLTYRPGTYAWFQLATLALFVPGQDLVVPTAIGPAAQLAEAVAGGVTAISATPSFWRVALLAGGVPPGLRPAQITLGGEPVDQACLDTLRALFPHARITHIYASTEAGACIVVHDGRAGFPADWLDRENDDRPRLRLRDGRLWLRSPTASPDVPDELDTGDAAEVRDGRVVILGRVGNAFLNVGGAKVHTSEVLQVILSHPAVLWCRVRGHEARLVGTLVAVDVAINPGFERPTEGELTRFAAARLPPHAVPRFFNVVDEIPLGDNLKTELG